MIPKSGNRIAPENRTAPTTAVRAAPAASGSALLLWLLFLGVGVGRSAWRSRDGGCRIAPGLCLRRPRQSRTPGCRSFLRLKRGRRSRTAVGALEPAQFRDVAQVLIIGVGKHMAAGPVSHKEHLFGAGRIRRSFERGAPGICDRTGRQPVDHVGVIGRRRFLFTLGNRMAERALAADEPVDDGWIRLQPLALLQPVDKDSSNTRALVGLAGFLLNDRCKNDKLLGRTDRQIR